MSDRKPNPLKPEDVPDAEGNGGTFTWDGDEDLRERVEDTAAALARFEAWAESTIERINYAIWRVNNPGGQHVVKCDPWERMPISAMQEMRRDLLHLLGREP